MIPSHQSIRDALQHCGPLTSADLARLLGADQWNVASALGKMRRAARKTVYIKAWEMHAPGEKSTPRAVYALGDAPDARRPPKQPNRVITARYRAKHKVRAPSSVFDLARFL